MRNIIYNSFNDIEIRTDNGQIFENYVYLQLLKIFKTSQIFYYRTQDGTEIDFIIQETNNNYIPVEVKFKNFQHHTKIRAITEFKKSVEFDTGYVFNRNLISLNENQYYLQAYLFQKAFLK